MPKKSPQKKPAARKPTPPPPESQPQENTRGRPPAILFSQGAVDETIFSMEEALEDLKKARRIMEEKGIEEVLIRATTIVRDHLPAVVKFVDDLLSDVKGKKLRDLTNTQSKLEFNQQRYLRYQKNRELPPDESGAR